MTQKKTSKRAVKKVKTTKKKVAAKKRQPTKKVAKSGAKPLAKSKSKSASVKVGQAIPRFSLPATGGKSVSSDSLKGKNVVLYFYPKDSTPGCTIEGHDFTKLHPEFQKHNTEVFGVSRDSMKSHENFKSKEGYCFDLLSDESGELTELFGVWVEKSMYGRKYMGIERSTFLIDANGVLRQEWRAVKVDGHAQEVLNAVKSSSY